MNEAELKAQRDAARIVKVTNPFDFDYTHAWGGTPYTLPMGKSLLFPYPLGDHLATHLARQALIRKAPVRDSAEIDGRGKDRPLWSEESIAELKATIIEEQYTEESKPVQSEAEQMKARIEELNRAFADLSDKVDGGNASLTPAPAPEVGPEAPEVAPSAPEVAPEVPSGESIPAPAVVDSLTIDFKDKAEVIAELTKRGVKFDARKNKTELEKLLAQPPEVTV